jgi:hypothetical protein
MEAKRIRQSAPLFGQSRDQRAATFSSSSLPVPMATIVRTATAATHHTSAAATSNHTRVHHVDDSGCHCPCVCGARTQHHDQHDAPVDIAAELALYNQLLAQQLARVQVAQQQTATAKAATPAALSQKAPPPHRSSASTALPSSPAKKPATETTMGAPVTATHSIQSADPWTATLKGLHMLPSKPAKTPKSPTAATISTTTTAAPAVSPPQPPQPPQPPKLVEAKPSAAATTGTAFAASGAAAAAANAGTPTAKPESTPTRVASEGLLPPSQAATPLSKPIKPETDKKPQ